MTPRTVLCVLLPIVLALLGCGAPSDAKLQNRDVEDLSLAPGELVATYYPTPSDVAEFMLEVAEAEPGETLFDLGSGDGRLVILAAQTGLRAVGFEIDLELVSLSRKRIKKLNLGERAEIRSQDLLTADLSAADIITVFLTPEALRKVAPRVADQVRAGARVVAYKFPLPGWEPTRKWTWKDEDPEIPDHELFLYRF